MTNDRAHIAWIAAVAVLVVGCSNDPPADPPLELECDAACNTADSCLGPFDQAACISQCELEAAGEGTLQAGVAHDFFTHLSYRPLPGDPSCELQSQWGYGWSPFVDGPIVVADEETLTPCINVFLGDGPGCGGVEVQESLRKRCFFMFYRYGDAIRQQLEPCFAESTCYAAGGCLGANGHAQLNAEQPWLGQVP